MGKLLNKIHLQLIAIIAMTIDHVTWLVYPGYPAELLPICLHIIGRLAFPIMAYFIAEGYHYTHDRKAYIKRIFIFALISHVPYMMQSIPFREYGWKSIVPFATGIGITRFLNQASVLWAYFIGLLMLVVCDNEKLKESTKTILILFLCLVSFPADWSCIGSMVVLSIGTNRDYPKKQITMSMFYICLYVVVYYFALDKVYGLLQLLVILAVPLLALYNGKKSSNETVNRFFRNFFYLYYPLHLLIIGIIGLFVQ